MDPINNPYVPGAGTKPPELAGRDSVRESIMIAIKRAAVGRSSKYAVLIGLRGVGKTVLLDRLCMDAHGEGILALRLEALENRSLPAILVPQLRIAMLELSRFEQARECAARGLRAIAGFVKGMKLKYQDIEFGLDIEPEKGLADLGDLQHDLAELIEVVGNAAHAKQTAIVIFLDEVQYIKEEEIAALTTALHRVMQKSLPVYFVGAGLPNLPGHFGRAKSYAERLFTFHAIGPLSESDAALAIVKPAQHHGVKVEKEALELIVEETQGYPYFLQEWGFHAWEIASGNTITHNDVKKATKIAIATLDESFFQMRFDRMTTLERKYLRSMAQLGKGPHRSGEIAKVLGKHVKMLGMVRAGLINKGMIYSPGYGETAFTVPLFDQFMKRIMPAQD